MHKKFECRVFKRKQNGERSNDKKEGKNVATTVDGDVYIICHNDIVSLTCQGSHWVIDSSASYHVTSHHDYFSSYTTSPFGHVNMENDEECEIIDMGDVHLDLNTRCKSILKNVRHIPNIHLNLISASVLDKEDYHNYFVEGK